MSIGEIIDQLYQTREERKALDRESKKLKLEENKLEQELIKLLDNPELGITQARGKRASFSFRKEVVPTATNWDLIWEFIFDTHDNALVGRTLLIDPWRTLKEQHNILVPGTEPFEKTKTSLNKIS